MIAVSTANAPAAALVGRHWITKREASRIVTVTEAGQDRLREWLGLDLAALRAA